jgi:hypothetical protein
MIATPRMLTATLLVLLVVTGFNGCKEEEQPITPASIASFSPASGMVGATVLIVGSFFDETPTNNIVKFNGVPAQ